MPLSVDIITLGVPEVKAACAFYTSAFSFPATVDGDLAVLDLHGTGQLALHRTAELAADAGTTPATSGFRGYVLSCIVNQPVEVKALLAAATAEGATVVKPAKKQLFGEFTATCRTPDGTVWKLAAATKKDDGTVPAPPKPTETAIYLGVTAPKASRTFYETLGMSAHHDYGDKFIDFTKADGMCRLGLLRRRALAKDVGVDERGEGFSSLVLTHAAATRDDVDSLLAAAGSAGGRVTAAAALTDDGDYAGYFTDPDGYHWKVTAPA